MVNRRFPCKKQGVFSGVPATEKFFMDRLHLLYFLEKGLYRFPVKMLQQQYHVSIMFEATFYAKNSVNPLKNVTPPENANADLANLIAALEQSPELVSMLTKALKQNAISS